MFKSFLIATGIIFGIAMATGVAAPIPVPNFSFEETPNSNVPKWAIGFPSPPASGTASVTGSPGSRQLVLGVNLFSGLGFFATAASPSNAVATIAPNTKYTLTVGANASGVATPEIDLLGNGGVIAFALVERGAPFTNYTATYTSGGAEDPHVGQQLNVNLMIYVSGPGGGGNAWFDDVLLDATPLTLSVAPAGGSQAQISWLTNFTGFTLTSNSDLAGTNWTVVTNAPVTQGGSYVVTVDAAASQNYFRLRKP